MPDAFNDSLKIDRRLFRVEVRASLAHSDALFRAGILTRLETERLKNGLWTMLKRAEHDRHYFDSLPSADVFSFVESRLFQLINESAEMLKIGRSREQRAAVALRLWSREEIRLIDDALAHLQDALHDVKADFANLSAFGEFFRRDAERLNETVRFLNRMPVLDAQSSADEQLAELDFFEVARELGFEGTTPTASKSFSDRDFCLDFAHAAVSIMLHLARLATECLQSNQNLPNETVHFFATVRAKSGKIFGFYTALLTVLKDSNYAANEAGQVNEIVFETADILKSSLSATVKVLNNLNP